MQYFVVQLSHKEKKTLSEDLLIQHVDFLKNLHAKGILVLCGPFTDDETAMQIYKVKDIDTAHNIIKQDPFMSSGYYQKYYKKYQPKTSVWWDFYFRIQCHVY